MFRVVGHLVFTLLAAGALFVCSSVVVGVFGLVGKPFVGLALVEEGLVNPVGLVAWGGQQAGFEMWDRIIAVDGELVFSKDDILERALAREVGAKVIYQVEGKAHDHRFVQFPTRIFAPSDLVKSHASLAVLGLIFVVVATLLYFLRPGTPDAWAFFALFASIGVAMTSVVDLTLLWKLPPLYPLLGPFLGTLGIILVGVITRAYTKVEGKRILEGSPEAGEPGFEKARRTRPQRRMWAITIVCLAVSATIAALLLTSAKRFERYTVLDSVFYTWLALCTVLAIVLLGVGYRRAKSSMRRRARIGQLLWTWPVGAGIPILNLLLGHVLQLQPMSVIWNGFLLLVPISTADAIVRHDLLQLDHGARRLVGGLTVAAVVGMGLGLVLWGTVQVLHLDDTPAMVALAALLFAIAAPLTHRMQNHIEELLRSKRYDAGRYVAEFTARASTATYMAAVLERLQDTLADTIKPGSFELYRLDRDAKRLLPLVGNQSVSVDDAVQAWLERVQPIVVDDESPAPPALHGTALAVRLAVANEPVGLLVIGARPESTPYEEQDVSFVAALAGPLAAALVNTLAFEAVERLVAQRTAELEQKNLELATMNARKDELVAMISHDFRSPLAVIRNNVQTILRDLTKMDRDDLRHFLQAISRQEDRLTALCTNLLDLARLKQKETPQAPVEMRDIAQHLVDDLQGRASAAGVSLALQVEENVPSIVLGDRDRLGQVLQNLIDNAIKFTPRGGRVLVRLAPAGEDKLTIEVKDTGVGVPADALPRLFEPFFQVPTNAHAGQGSGLGLAIVKAVVDAHHGEVNVESTEGAGTTFTVTLPGRAPGRFSGGDELGDTRAA